MPGRLKNNDGSALLLALLVIVMLSLLFNASVNTSLTDKQIAENHKDRTSAFYIAEGGLELATAVLNENPNELDNDTLENLINAGASLGNGTFRVEVSDTLSYKMLTSYGSSGDGKAIVQVMVEKVDGNDLSIWDNIIFAGEGQNDRVLNGNISLHGSVHLLGNSLDSTDVALAFSGQARMYNNYEGMNATLSSRVPAPDTVTFNGEVVSTLTAELRVKHGRVDLSGDTASVGRVDVPEGSPPVKETVDGCYVTDGYGGNQEDPRIYSDNGSSEAYDCGDGLNFPGLNDPYTDPNTGITYPTHVNYLQNNALVINGDLTLQVGHAQVALSNGFGRIQMNANGNLQISGIVYVTGDINIEAGVHGQKHIPITYDGKGTLVSQDDIFINTHVISKGMFPTNDVMGFIAADELVIGSGSGAAQLDIMGAFYAENQIINRKQNQLAGAMISNYFDMDQVPDVFHVPSIVENMPPGMPGGGVANSATGYRIVLGTWHEL